MNTTELKLQLESSLVFETRTYTYWFRQFQARSYGALGGKSLEEQDKIIKSFNQADKELGNSRTRLFKIVDDLEAVLRYEQITGAKP